MHHQILTMILTYVTYQSGQLAAPWWDCTIYFCRKKGENKQQWTAHTHKWLMKLQFIVHYAWEDGNKAQQSSVMQFHENK